MTRLNAKALRDNLSDTVNRVAYKGERIVLERHGKEVAALVPIEDLRLLERVLEELEDRLDVEGAEEALQRLEQAEAFDALTVREAGVENRALTVTLAELKKRLGL